MDEVITMYTDGLDTYIRILVERNQHDTPKRTLVEADDQANYNGDHFCTQTTGSQRRDTQAGTALLGNIDTQHSQSVEVKSRIGDESE